MRKYKLTPLWLIISLAVSSCAPAMAEYCDTAHGPVQFTSPDAVPALLDMGERAALELIDADNRSGVRLCGWVLQ